VAREPKEWLKPPRITLDRLCAVASHVLRVDLNFVRVYQSKGSRILKPDSIQEGDTLVFSCGENYLARQQSKEFTPTKNLVDLKGAIDGLVAKKADGAIQFLQQTLGNISREPLAPSLRSVRIDDVKNIDSGGDAAIVLYHAGFITENAYYVLPPTAAVDKVKTALAALSRAHARG